MTTGDVIRYYTRSVNIFGGNQQRIRVQNTVFEYFKYFSSRVMLNYIFMAWKLQKRLEGKSCGIISALFVSTTRIPRKKKIFNKLLL